MSLFALADTHLSFAQPKPMDVFGSRWSGFETKLKENWNAFVGENDTVVMPGDISWSSDFAGLEPDFDFLASLNGKKIIGKGNHDYWWQTRKKLDEFVSSHGYTCFDFLHNNAIFAEGFVIAGSRGWYTEDKPTPAVRGADNVKLLAREVERIRMSLSAAKQIAEEHREHGALPEILAFLHFPAVFRGYVCDEIVLELYRAGVERCYFGHIHGTYDAPGSTEYSDIRFTLISADYLDFRPLRIDKK